MGTLTNQPPRNKLDIDSAEMMRAIRFVEDNSTGEFTPRDIIEIGKMLEMRRANDLAVMNGDIHDEQMAGIGERFDQLIIALEGLNNAG